MGKINVLSFAVANLIAAGEVVDRPASVIKELLENAIDSGADRITIEIQNGGVTYMRVADNGCGISAEDLPVSIRRHATSKIKEAKDLDGILTLGFRGEALAAIASVSDLRIISKTADAPVGAMLEAHGGEIAGVFERASADGTTVIVENLFANVPARRKFLKKDVTETMAVTAVVEKIALSHPAISFRLITDGTIRMETTGDGDLKNTVWSVFGKEFASKLIPTELTVDGIEVHGFVGRPDNVRANRNYQNFFINGRYVKSKTACAALEQAYTSYIATERFPACILFLTIHPAAVDVNVHPAKLEVKFSNEKPVFEAIYYAVRNALEANTARPDVTLTPISQRKGRIEEKLSDAQTPIRDGREESLKARQIAATMTVAEPKKVVAEAPKKPTPGFATMTAEDYLKAFVKETPKMPKEAPKASPPTPKAESPKVEHPKQDENKQETSKQEVARIEVPAVPQSLEYRIL
ncbi:MAG: DNA mismatch repair endonuclease MutL, partial [Clostridia bacterium]|nr:DNA mismatch repair endonuclease MutL [Clostridia bacterium]